MEENKNVEIGKRIKNIRISLGKNMEEFGKRLAPVATKGTVSKWENGKYIPNNDRLRQIAELGNVSMTYLLEGTKTTEDILKDSIVRKLADEAVEKVGQNEPTVNVTNFSIEKVEGKHSIFNAEINLNSTPLVISGFFFTQKYDFFSDNNDALFINFDFDINSNAFVDLFRNIAFTILREIGYKQNETDDIPIIYAEPHNGDYRAKKIDYINL